MIARVRAGERVSTVTRRVHKDGTPIIVPRLIDAHRGRAQARRHGGPGTTFSFTLPRS